VFVRRPTRAGPAVDALLESLEDASLRQLIFAWFTVNAGKWGLLVVTLGIAYERGGPLTVGLLGVVRYLTPAILAPFAGVPVARWPAERVLLATNAIRTVAAVGVLGVIMTHAPFAALALVVGLEAGIGAFTRPIHLGLLPACSRSPGQLVAANVASSAAEGLGTFVGPALAGVLLIVNGPTGAVLAVVGIYALGVSVIARTHIPTVGRRGRPDDLRAVIDGLGEGIRAARTLQGPRLVLIGIALQTFVRGLLTVTIVVTSIELLGMGGAGVGTLNAAMGLGGLIGAIVSITLAGRARLAPAFVIAMAGWGAPIAVIGLVVHPAAALAAMLCVGISNAFIDVAGYTLVQRTAPNRARIAVLGLIDGIANLGPAIGGIVAPLLIALVGVRGALVATGVILPIAAVGMAIAMRHLDEGGPAAARRVDLLRGVPLFAPLSVATIEHLAARMVPVMAEPGTWLMREGEQGDSFFLIDQGAIEVTKAGRPVRTLGPGAGVGEIALLEDVPRTASVSATDKVAAFSLDREAFLEAVTGHRVSNEVARTVAAEHHSADARLVD
jgi:hypothetical protein